MRSAMTRPVLVSVALVALANSGCLVVGAGVAGGAVAGYYYAKGRVNQTYNAGYVETVTATRAVLSELNVTVTGEERTAAGGTLDCRAGNGERIRVTVESLPRATGAATEVGVRVATFGDQPLSEHILAGVGHRLTPARLTGDVKPQPGETVAPPLAPDALPPQPVPADKEWRPATIPKSP